MAEHSDLKAGIKNTWFLCSSRRQHLSQHFNARCRAVDAHHKYLTSQLIAIYPIYLYFVLYYTLTYMGLENSLHE
jgi:hypothetical protein